MSRRFGRLAVFAAIFAAAIYLAFSVLPSTLSDIFYKTAYEAEVNKCCEDFSVDPALVYAVIKVESNFNPDAYSEIGAVGLMQIIEDSFDWVAWRLNREDLRFTDMYKPEYSILFGTYMLGVLYEKYGSVELTAAAYHAGMGEVDGWIERGEIDPENVDLDGIKGRSTRHYVEKVLKAYKIYSNKLKR